MNAEINKAVQEAQKVVENFTGLLKSLENQMSPEQKKVYQGMKADINKEISKGNGNINREKLIKKWTLEALKVEQ